MRLSARLPLLARRARKASSSVVSALLAVTTVGLGVGCAGESPPPGGAGPSSPDLPRASERLAIVSLTWRADEPGLAQGYVVDYPSGELRRVLEVLSEPSAMPLLDPSLGLDHCRVESRERDASPMLLRDAGELVVEVGGVSTPLDFRWLPEGSLEVSGPAYSSLVPPLPPLSARARHDRRAPATSGPSGTSSADAPTLVGFAADGSAEIGAFAVTAAIPPRVALRAIDGLAVRDGRVAIEDAGPGVLDLDDGVLITWEAPRATVHAEGAGATGFWGRPDALRNAASAELTLVLFERVAFGETWSITCAVADDGHFSIPAAAVLALPDLGPDQTDRVLVRRIAGASFSAREVPDGLVLVVSEDQAYLE